MAVIDKSTSQSSTPSVTSQPGDLRWAVLLLLA